MGFFYCVCCDKLDDDLKFNFSTIRWCKTCNYRILKSDEVAVKEKKIDAVIRFSVKNETGDRLKFFMKLYEMLEDLKNE